MKTKLAVLTTIALTFTWCNVQQATAQLDQSDNDQAGMNRDLDTDVERSSRKAGQDKQDSRQQSEAWIRKHRAGVARLFRRLDSDRNGELSSFELPAHLRGKIGEADEDGNGSVSKKEMAAVYRNRYQSRRNAALQKQERERVASSKLRKISSPDSKVSPEELISMLDRNQDQLISAEEVPKRVQKNFDRLDANGDEQLDKSELVSMIERMRAKAQSVKKYESNSELSKGRIPKRPPRR